MPLSKPPARPVEAALADWANDDLLIRDEARRALYADHPKVGALMDWPALRTLFQQHEGPANREKRRVRAGGRRAVWFAFLAFTAAALGTLPIGSANSALALAWASAMGLGTAVFAAISFVGGLVQMFHGEGKTRWMVERLWTEALRRFFYQFLIRNLALAVDVMAGAKPLADWQAAQAAALGRLEHDEMARPTDALRDVLNDRAEAKVWTLTAWQTSQALSPVGPSREIDELLGVLERKRLQCQKDYTTRKLEGSKMALRRRAMLIRATFYILVFGVLLLDVVGGVLRGLGAIGMPLPELLDALVASAALGAAAIVALQMWDRGERITGETERMEWYLAGVDSIHRRYQLKADPTDRIRAFVELEALAYQEMRQFLVSVDRGEFVAG